MRRHMRRRLSGTLATTMALTLATLATACGGPGETGQAAELSDAQLEELVRRSYQYVAMYNVNQKLALAEEGQTTRGYNKGLRNTELLDHTAQFIARPNNDVLYQLAMLDLRKDAAVFEIPAIDSKYVSIMTSGYDHYVGIPMSTTQGDFGEPKTILFFTERTEGYSGEDVEGIDEAFEMSGDFVSVTMRVMPHANDPERRARIMESVENIRGMTLSEYRGEPAPESDPVDFPAYGETDADIFGDNLLEVMQFVFNHTTFDPDFELDREVLAVYAPLGVVPGREYDPADVVELDGDRVREMSIRVRDEEIAKINDPDAVERLLSTLFQPKGSAGLESILFPSVIGPIGQPEQEALYPPVVTADGAPMNALNDYVIRMTDQELPPANGFWSLTLYDAVNGFFIPNEQRKYSVGENAGFQLNDDGGIEIHIAAEQPDGVPADNWLPIQREDLELNVILRIYAPDLEGYENWTPPVAERVGP